MKYEQNEEKLLNVRETAKLLGVHENTVRNWVKTGVLNSSRLPGASSHRFSIEEVMRLKRSKGKLVASLAPTMKTSGPELITGHELNTWASRDDSKGTFPELMRRLLAQTPGISNLDIRAHEGGAAEWWDGTATSLGSSFLPAGELRFEFSTESNPKSKADRDFRNRRPNSPADKKNIFVFATPRSWPGAKKWAAERASEKKFAGVKAIDAHVLEGWLQSVVPVHYWISERLGFRPRGVRSLENCGESSKIEPR
ncbi:MAG: helix-turn-helix domain-containing protein [Actinomycetota bacterium]